MIKVFISQPMANKTGKKILQERERAVKRVKKHFDDDDIKIVDSYLGMAGVAHPLALLGKSLIALSTADVAYFVKDFEKYRGCQMENMAAIAYGIEVIEEHE
jgi:hypothetical protein